MNIENRNNLLHVLKISARLNFVIKLNPKQVSAFLKENIDSDKNGVFGKMLDNLSESIKENKNSLIGRVDTHAFTVRKRRELLNLNRRSAQAHGTYYKEEEVTLVQIEISAFNKAVAALLFLKLIIFALLVIILGVTGGPLFRGTGIFIVALVLFIIFIVPIILMRRSTQKLKNRLHDLFVKLEQENNAGDSF